MSNLAIDININAPELVGAIEHLCVALGKPVSLVASTAAKQEPAPQPQSQPKAVQPPKPGFYQTMQASEYRRPAAPPPGHHPAPPRRAWPPGGGRAVFFFFYGNFKP